MHTPSIVRVLLVEDNPTDALVTVHALPSSRFQVRNTDRLAAALDLLSAANFDVVVLDLDLPDSQGLDTLRTLRMRNSRVPVVVLTGKDDEDLALHALKEGAQDYQVKGQVHNDVLGRTIRYAIERNQADIALHEASDFNRQIIAGAQEGIIVLDRGLRYRVWNAYMEGLSGLKSADVLGKHPWQVLPFVTEAMAWAGLDAALAGETIVLPDMFVEPPPPGRTAWVWQQVSPLRNSTGQIVGVICMVRDITERKRAETESREQSRLSTLSADVGLAFTRGGTLTEMLQRSVESMVRNLEAAFARIWTLNEAANSLELQASAGMYTHLNGPHSWVPVGKFKIGLIAEEKTPHLTNDVAHDPRISDPEWAAREGMVAFAGYPLLVEGRLVGVMALFARKPITNTAFQALASVANQIALGIEHKQGEEILHDAEARNAAILEASLDAIVSMDHAGRILGFNPGAERIFGFTEAEAMGQMLAELIVPRALRSLHYEGLSRYLDGGPSTVLNKRLELPALRKDGSEFPVELAITRIRGEGAPVFTAFVRDITERKRAEEALRESEARLRTILNSEPECVKCLDRDCVLLQMNPAGVAMIETDSVEQVIGKSILGIVDAPFRGAFRALTEQVFRGESGILEFSITRLKGTRRWLETHAGPLHDTSGRVVSLIAITRDITERRRAEESLKLFRTLLDHSNDAIEVIDPATGRFLDMNQKGCETLGYSREEILRLSVTDIDPLVAQRGWAKAAEDVGRTGSLVLETQHQRKDGSVFPVEIDVKLVHMDRHYMVAVVRDVTERKRTERRMLAQHAVSRVLAEAASLPEASTQILQTLCEGLSWELGALWSVDRSDQSLRCIQIWHVPMEQLAEFAAASKQFTFRPDVGLPGRVWVSREAEWIPDVAGDARLPRRALAIQSGLRVGLAFPIILGNEVLGVLEFFSQEQRQPDEEILKMMTAVGSQIGQFIERKQAEESLRDTNENLRTLIQAAPLAIIALSPQGIVRAWNPAAERIFGWTEEEVLGRPLPYIPSDKRDESQTMFQKELEGQEVIGLETQRMRKDGSLVDIRLSTAPLRDTAGNIVGFLGLIGDITEQKRLEEQFRQAQKMEAIGQLAGGVAHDFNNLLTIISGYSEIMLTRLESNDPMRESIKAISEAGQRAASLTRQLLAFSRKSVLEPKVLDLNKVVKETEKLLRRLIGEDILLTAVLGSSISRVMVDPNQLGQVLINLAVNARDAMPKGGKLTIETRNVDLDEEYVRVRPEVPPGEYVLLTITDSGRGMTTDVKSRIFEPFYTTKGVGEGSGLGLSVVLGIVKQSNGHLEVYSEPGIGTSFKIFLPAVKELVSVSKEIGPASAARGTETILLVEDEDGVRGLAFHILKTHGYNVLAARDGKDAIRLVETKPIAIDMLMTDVVMPGMGGPELAEVLKPRFPQMKVLFSSGYTDDEVVRHGILQEKVAFLQKPYSPLALVRKIRQILDEK